MHIDHALLADFTAGQDTICLGTKVQFTNTSFGTFPDSVAFLWDFGDGTQRTTLHSGHQYQQAGAFRVMLAAEDFVPCRDTAYATIVVDAPAEPGFVLDKTQICTGQSINFKTLADSTAVELHWDFGDGTLVASPAMEAFQHAYAVPGSYAVTLFNQLRACPDTSYTDSIIVYPLPEVDLGADSSICFHGQPVYLKNLRDAPLDPYHQVWSTGDTTEILQVVHAGIYSLSVTTEPIGCTTTESIEISRDCYLDIPNAFTPNGDGHNDYFLPRQLLSESLSRFRMQVYNRWGQLVFETDRPDGRGWDGRFNAIEQSVGVYLYRIEADYKSGVREQYDGNVTLIR